MATLRELLDAIEGLDDNKTLFVSKPWRADSDAVALECGDDDDARSDADGRVYFLEVDLAIEVINVWEEWHAQTASSDDRCRAVIHYAQNDAYLE